MRACLFPSHDPSLNLALEEVLLTKVHEEGTYDDDLCLVWQNAPSVIVGRHQSTALVVNANFVRSNTIPVVRRLSGGGAVYHDLGNLNVSFFSKRKHPLSFACEPYLGILCTALQTLGLSARPTGRNDLEVEGKKISGTSQVCVHDTILFHGTLLVGVDLRSLAQALLVDAEKLRSKGISSVSARVANVRDLVAFPATTEELCARLTLALCAQCVPGDHTLAQEDIARAEKLAASKYRQWDWNYGMSPPYTQEVCRRFPWGLVRLRLSFRGGRIASCALSGDFISLRDPKELEDLLKGQSWNPACVHALVRDVPWAAYFLHCDPDVMRDFFVGAADEQGLSS